MTVSIRWTRWIGWRLAVLALAAPILVGGFAASALANRWSFAVWAMGAALVAVLTLRRGIETWRGRPAAGPRVAVRVLAVLAPAIALFAWLVDRHQEVFDLGFRAVWPALHSPALTTPVTYGIAATVLAVGAVGAWGAAVRSGSGERRDRIRSQESAVRSPKS